MIRRMRVSQPHRPDDGEPLVAQAGERFHFEHRQTEWPGWIWCTNDAGAAGWAPESWIAPEDVDAGSCIFRRDYDATELSVDVGETLMVEIEESGWAHVTDSRARRGWVPLRNLERF